MICLHNESKVSYYLKKYDTSDYYHRTPPPVQNLLTDVLKRCPYNAGVMYVEGNFVVPFEYLGRI